MKNKNLVVYALAGFIAAAGAISMGYSAISANNLQANTLAICPGQYSETASYSYGSTILFQGKAYKCIWDSYNCSKNAPGQTGGWSATGQDVSHCSSFNPGDSTVKGDLKVEGMITATKDIKSPYIEAVAGYFDGLEVIENLVMTGTITGPDAMPVKIANGLDVKGEIEATNLIVNSNSTFNQDVNFQSNTIVGGEVMTNKLSLSGLMRLGSDASIASSSGTMKIDNNNLRAYSIDAQEGEFGVFRASSPSNFSSNLSVGGNLTVTGNAWAGEYNRGSADGFKCKQGDFMIGANVNASGVMTSVICSAL